MLWKLCYGMMANINGRLLRQMLQSSKHHGKPWEVERPKHKQTQSNLGLTIIENAMSCKNPRTLHLKKNIRNEQNWKDNT